PGAATTTTSPPVIVIELGYRFNPSQRVALILGVQSGYRSRYPAPNLFRSGIGHDKAQFAQTAHSAPLSHYLHPFGRLGHAASPEIAIYNVTRYAATPP